MKKVKAIITVLVVVIMIGVTALGTFISYNNYKIVKEKIDAEKEKEKKERETVEDNENVMIADQYQIISTKNISDAYINKDDSKLNAEDKKTLKVASDILDSIIKDEMSNYEKEKAIYEWICDNVKHDDNGMVAVQEARGIVDRPYGVLQNKQAVCVGYATSFRLLANMVGLECMVMHDASCGHSWDLVKLDDNCWYIVDCYFDTPDMNGKFSSFNMCKERAESNHSWDSNLFPVANGKEYEYSLMNKITVKDTNELLKDLKKKFDTTKEYRNFYEIDTKDTNNVKRISYIIEGINSRAYKEGEKYYLSCSSYFTSENKIIFDFSVHFNSEANAGSNNSELIEDFNKIDEKLNEIFGEQINYDDNYFYEGGAKG